MLASSLLSYQDTSFDPCEDFVGYATAGWVKSNPLPKSKAIWGSFNQVQKHNQQVVLEILKRPIEIKSEAELKKETPEQKAEQENLVILKTAFNDCLDEDQLDKIGTAPLLDIVDHIQTLFPAVYPKSAAAIAVEASHASKAWYSFAELEKNAKAAVDRIMGGEVVSLASAVDEAVEELKGKDKEPSRKVKLTNVLAYLHAKGQSALSIDISAIVRPLTSFPAVQMFPPSSNSTLRVTLARTRRCRFSPSTRPQQDCLLRYVILIGTP